MKAFLSGFSASFRANTSYSTHASGSTCIGTVMAVTTVTKQGHHDGERGGSGRGQSGRARAAAVLPLRYVRMRGLAVSGGSKVRIDNVI